MGIANITQEAVHTFKLEGLASGKDNRQARQHPEIKMKGLWILKSGHLLVKWQGSVSNSKKTQMYLQPFLAPITEGMMLS